jgi:hypothetical protein
MPASTAQTDNERPPRADLAVGMERYFLFLRQQMDLHREFTMTWAAAVTSVSAAVLAQLQTVEHIMAGHADQIAEHAHGAERVTADIVEQVGIAERTIGSLPDHQPPAAPLGNHRLPVQVTAAASADATREHIKATPDIFDELLELIVDEDIKAAIP